MDSLIVRVLVAILAVAVVVNAAVVVHHPKPRPNPPSPTSPPTSPPTTPPAPPCTGKRCRTSPPCTGKRCQRQFQLATLQNLPSDCQAEVDVEKRDGSGDIDFVVCIKDVVCTTRDVDACSTVAQDCEMFKSPDKEAFKAMFPDAYAKVCAEPANGDLCLYTDVVYKTCGEAEMMSANEICLTLSNGEVECSEIPQEYFIQKMMAELENHDEKLPQYKPPSQMNKEAKSMNENVICITLSNGERECSEIPAKQRTVQDAHYGYRGGF